MSSDFFGCVWTTLRPTMTVPPSAAQAMEKPSPPSCTVAVHVLLRTFQNLQVPSLEIEASSSSLVGLKAILSIPAVCPLNSVLYLTWGLSGIHARKVRSALPVAIQTPVALHAMVRMLWVGSMSRRMDRVDRGPTCGSRARAMLDHGMLGSLG